MSYVQSISGSSAGNANISTFPLTLPNNLTRGNALVIDLCWRAAAGGVGDIGVLDAPANTFTKVFGPVQNASSGQFVEQWIAVNIAPGSGLDTVVAAYTPSSGPSYFADIAMAVHEITPVSGVDGFQAVWGTAGANPVAASATVTTTGHGDFIHAFGACPAGGRTGNSTPIYLDTGSVGAGWNLRESTGGTGPLNALVAYDMSQASPGAIAFDDMIGHAAFLNVAACITAFLIPYSPATPGGAWLIIDEPASVNPAPGYTDRTAFLAFGKGTKHSFTNTLQQRGTAEIPLALKAANTYDATKIEGCQVFLYDQPPSGPVLSWAGTIERVTQVQQGLQGDRLATLTCISFRQAFDVLQVPPQSFQSKQAGEIFTQLFNSVAAGVPLKLGTVNAAFVIDSISFNFNRLSEAFDQIAAQASCIWDIDLPTLTVYLKPPSTTAAPYTITSRQLLYGSPTHQLDRKDYRNRQILRIAQNAFAPSTDVFAFTGIPMTAILKRAAQSITNAWLTNNTQNTATGTFTALPAAGDTITISYPQSGSIYNWAPNAPYSVGQVIIDPANHIQVVTVKGTSGGTEPAWNDTGGITTDGPGSNVQPGFNGTVIWQDQGVSGPGGIGASVYTFVDVLDNAQWGQVLIGSTIGQACQNLADAIACTPAVQGQTFSWPTWENPIVNATPPGGFSATLAIQNKGTGSGYIAALSASSSAFSWSAGATSGGVTNFNTFPLQVSQNGSSNTSNLYYTPGTNVVALASSPTTDSETFLVVEYQRAGGDSIVVENTAQVLLRAVQENGTGKYQQILDDTSITSNTEGLQYAQSILAAYDEIPVSFSFKDVPPGLLPGQLLTISVPSPASLTGLINGTFFIQEVAAELVPAKPWMNQVSCPGGGHYKYTVTVINESQVQSWLAFWQQLASGGGGGSSSIIAGSAVAPAGSATPSGAPLPVTASKGY